MCAVYALTGPRDIPSNRSVQQTLNIGTRGSPLALWQANTVRDALIAAHPELTPDAVNIVVVKTSGDLMTAGPLRDLGGKGLFTKELEEMLLDGRLDCAVHSTKDMPTKLPDGLTLSAFLDRADPRDAWIAAGGESLDDLPRGAVVGTASLRRKAQILVRRPDLEIRVFRGNVETRLRKLAEGEAQATLLAMAGLVRLGRADAVTTALDTDIMLPAPAQGAVCVESRVGDARMAELLAPLDHAPTRHAVTAERAFLAALEGSCRTPIAALAQVEKDGGLRLDGRLIAPDGSQMFQTSRHGAAADAARMGQEAGAALRAEAGEDVMRRILEAG